MKKTIAALAMLVAVLAAGCRYVNEDPIFTVEDSSLSWLEMHYCNYRRLPIQRVRVKLDGTGFVEVKHGTSKRVSSEFAKDNGDGTFQDYHYSRINITPEEMKQVFQHLVDNGLFKKRWRRNSNVNSNEAIFVQANINNHTCGSQDDVFVTNPELGDSLQNVMLMFYHPSPRRSRKSSLDE